MKTAFKLFRHLTDPHIVYVWYVEILHTGEHIPLSQALTLKGAVDSIPDLRCLTDESKARLGVPYKTADQGTPVIVVQDKLRFATAGPELTGNDDVDEFEGKTPEELANKVRCCLADLNCFEEDEEERSPGSPAVR